MNITKQNGSAKAIKSLNIRKGQPSTGAPVVASAQVGQIISFVGWVSDGEMVQGNAKWFQTVDGNYFWSGNVEVFKEQTTTASSQTVQFRGVSSLQLRDIVPALAIGKADELIGLLNGAMKEFGIDTPVRQGMFIAQTAHESGGYNVFVENLNYSAQGLLRIWPKRFTPTTAALYARQQEKIANFVYANRGGNGDEASGDGWKYRGRGIMQTTFHDNYKVCGDALNLDLVSHPELLELPVNAFRSGGLYWKKNNINQFADKNDFIGVTRAINTACAHLAERQKLYDLAKKVLDIQF